MIYQSLSQKTIFYYTILLFSIIFMGPFYFNILMPELKLIPIICASIIIFLFMYKEKIIYDKFILNILAIEVFCFLLLTFVHEDITYLQTAFNSHLYLIFIYLFIKNFFDKNEVLYFIFSIISIMSIFSVIAFSLIIVGVNLPFVETLSYDERPLYNFFITFSVAYYQDLSLLRPAGFFDEPGMLAFVLFISIILNDLTLKNKFFRFVFIVAGFCTLSLAFILIYSFYFFTNLGFIKKIKYVFLIFISIFILFILFQDSYVFEVVNHHTIGRLAFYENSEGFFHGDNRTPEVLKSFDLLLSEPSKFIFGFGYQEIINRYGYTLSSNFIAPILYNGILGYVLFLHYLVIVFKPFKRVMLNFKINKQEFIIALSLLLLIIQRPIPFGILTMLLIIFIIESLYNKNNIGVKVNENSN